MIKKTFFMPILLNFMLIISLSAQTEEGIGKSDNTFLQSTIKFDNSSLKKIVLEPEFILNNPKTFWENDSAYKFYKQWHQQISYPIDMNQWKKELQPFVETPEDVRFNNKQLILSKSALNQEKIKEFNNRAIPYLYSFLPSNCPQIDATIYFTTAIQPNGFQMGNDVVIYGENADKENLFIHELFHSCQRACKPISDYEDTQTPDLDQIYLLLWIEGTATYVGYKALDKFPSVDPLLKKDYELLDDTISITNLRQKLNSFYSSIANNSLDKNELQGKMIQIGVMERAFYIVGFSMASTIDEKLGREALKETLLHGPDYFIKKYNSLVDSDYKIVDLYSMR